MSLGKDNGKSVQGLDISIVKLIPRSERKVAKKYRQRIEASLRAVGLIEPLIVYPINDSFEILDGSLRYRILLDLGVESVPCLIHSTRDGFTGNRMVNQLSASQEMRMLRKSLEELDEKTIASALGMQGIGHRLNKGLLEKLHPSVVNAFNANLINLQQPRSTSLFADAPCGTGNCLRRHFVEYGGLIMPKKLWCKERVVAELKQHRQDGPRMHPQLDAAARRHFGSVREALRVAGLPCGKRQPPYFEWSQELVIQAIRQRHENGKCLDCTNQEDPSLYSAGKRLFGNWTAARAAAGFPRPPREYYSADEVQLRIIDLYERELPLTYRSHNDEKLKRSATTPANTTRPTLSSAIGSMATPNRPV
jgi:ParB-like nuclease domain